MTRLTIISFSCGLDSAIITVSATSVWSAMRFEPSLRRSNLLRFRKYRNNPAAIAAPIHILISLYVLASGGPFQSGGISAIGFAAFEGWCIR